MLYIRGESYCEASEKLKGDEILSRRLTYVKRTDTLCAVFGREKKCWFMDFMIP